MPDKSRAKKYIPLIVIIYFACIYPSHSWSQGIIGLIKSHVSNLSQKKLEKASQTAVEASNSVSTVVGPEGGTVSSISGSFSIIIPQNALNENVIVKMWEDDADPGKNEYFSIKKQYSGGVSGQNMSAQESQLFSVNPECPLKLKAYYNEEWYPSWNVVDKPKDFTICYTAYQSEDGKGETQTRLVLKSEVNENDKSIIADFSPSNVWKCNGNVNPVYFLPLGNNMGAVYVNGGEEVASFSNYHCEPWQIINKEVIDPRFKDEKRKEYLEYNTLKDSFTTGQKWQCIEYPVRYYHIRYGKNIKGIDGTCNPSDLWNDIYKYRELERYENGNSKNSGAPRDGDILVLANKGTIEHVSVVQRVSGNWVYTIQQNWFCNKGDANTQMPYNPATNFIDPIMKDSSWRVKGWLRLAGNTPANLPQNNASPNSPSDLKLSFLSSSGFSLSWQDNSSNEDGFRIERSIGSSNNFTLLASVGLNQNTFSDTGLPPNTQFSYRIAAYNSQGSSYSTILSAYTLPIDFPTTICAPTGLKTFSVSYGQINLSWKDNSNNENGFKIERKMNYNGNYSVIATVGINATSFNDVNIMASGQYYYRVCAFNSIGTSGYSNEASASNAALNTNLQVVPLSGSKGTLFTYYCTGFTPNSTVTKHVKKPDGTEYPTTTDMVYFTDSLGRFVNTYNSSTCSVLGVYEIWFVDNQTGLVSNHVAQTITW
ncbi:MAG: fibronectin type III domain-containing protein [Candidatus Pacebacteria bacterium]|nr:fibronectin type III domain-containing protein [Candidatus Paceibacterota bacterium]